MITHQDPSVHSPALLQVIYGTMQELADGSRVLTDDAYLRSSIVEPQASIVKGYAAAMPSYAGRLSEAQISEPCAYIRSLATPPAK
jgi:cytochrome c oxidase subunit 2